MRRSASWNNAIWCVNALLALGIIGFSFKYIFLADHNDAWPENPPQPTAGTVVPGKGLNEFESIWKAELIPPPQGPVKPVETWPQLKYDGRFLSQVLLKVNGQEGQVKVGGAIEVRAGEDAWQPATVNGKKIILKEVTREEAIFHLEDNPEETRTIKILDQEGGGATPGPPNPDGPDGMGPGKAPEIRFGTKEIADQTWKVDPRERDFVRANAREMMKDVRWSLYGVEDGKAKGVRIEGFTPGSYAEEYAKTRGIQPGDIVMTMNGRVIDGAETVNDLFGNGDAWAAGKAQVEVERAGKVQVLSYSVK